MEAEQHFCDLRRLGTTSRYRRNDMAHYGGPGGEVLRGEVPGREMLELRCRKERWPWMRCLTVAVGMRPVVAAGGYFQFYA